MDCAADSPKLNEMRDDVARRVEQDGRNAALNFLMSRGLSKTQARAVLLWIAKDH